MPAHEPSPTGRPSGDEIERIALAYLRHAPLPLALREINRMIGFMSVASGAGPVLDVGCGDGFWWTQMSTQGREIYGIDISESELAQARERIHAELTDVSTTVPFPGVGFKEIVGNCSLEHVPDIDAALSNLRKAAAPDARLLLFVPTPQWAFQGNTQQFLLRRAPRIAMTVSGALNGFFQHWHLYDTKVWSHLLAKNGWRVTASYGLGSKRSELLFRLLLPPAYLEFVAKKLTGFYPAKLAEKLPDSALAPLARFIRWAVDDPIVSPDSQHASECLIVADASEVK